MFKWLGLAASFFIGRMNKSGGFHLNIKEVSMEVLSGITQRGRRYVSLALIGLGSVVLACAGILIAVLNATGQYDRSGQVLFTSTFGAGLFMTLIAAGAFAWVFMREWPRSHKGVHISAHADVRHGVHERERAPSSIENAVSALIMDFVHEREFKRTGREPEYEMTRAERREARRAERERERDRRMEREQPIEREPSPSVDPSQYPH